MIIDTNVLVNLFTSEFVKLSDSEKAVNQKFLNLEKQNCLIPDFVLTEYSIVMARIIPTKLRLKGDEYLRKQINNHVIQLFSASKDLYTIITPTHKEIHLAFEIFELINHDSVVNDSFADVLLLAMSRERKQEILTNDSRLTYITTLQRKNQ